MLDLDLRMKQILPDYAKVYVIYTIEESILTRTPLGNLHP